MIKNRRDQFPFQLACATLAGVAFFSGCSSTPMVAPKPTGWIKDEVADSYVFAYPLVLMGAARDAAVGTGPGQAPVNTLRHASALPPVGAHNPPTPGIDTLDSTAWLDVDDEPVIVSLPSSAGRYMDARALDMWTNVLWSTSTRGAARVSGVKAQTVAFAKPGWKGDLPKDVKRIDAPTRNIWLDVRIQSNGGRDLTAVRKVQRGVRVMPLSVYVGEEQAASVAPRSMPADANPGTPAEQVAALDAKGFFDRVAQLLPDNPPSPEDPHALKFLSDLGVKPDEPVELPAKAADAIASGLADGRTRIATPPGNMLTANGWSFFGEGAGNYGPDYALRAYAAYAQPGIGTKDDELRGSVSLDSDGHALNGANRYVMHFAPNQVPPVRGFWSVTAYTKDGALGDSTPSRASVGDKSGVRRNRDGSVDVTVSAAKPRKASNWLPAPRGDFQMVLRLYAPKPEASDGSWQPPAVVRQ
ncbi:DUF1254 domain-containing protein [Paraburkholderia phymatum]|uniref:Lipoprotein n=1 Tax=Paraburkholderia phymatum (strain DSM 17167 / CIP 108236 / LMG 21445 / STM815) TaxID=391038 RepID=B2JQ92_PARP8|nr:DUF1254 domain-containing protein [Paraburkholderia phymatum]ACC73433.1 protein of unknown function DUF1214 [Paraburkholderia phymatum STM815]